MFLNIQIRNVRENAKSFKYETKPVGGGKWLFEWVSHQLSLHSTDSFKLLIHSETRQVTTVYEWVTGSLTHLIRSKTWIHSVTKHRCVARRHKTVLLWVWLELFSSAKLCKNSQYCLKFKSLNFNLLFIELLYKVAVWRQNRPALQTDWPVTGLGRSCGKSAKGWFILDASASLLGCAWQIWRVGGSSLWVCVAVSTAFFVTFRAAPLPKMHDFRVILAEHARLCQHLCETEAV